MPADPNELGCWNPQLPARLTFYPVRLRKLVQLVLLLACAAAQAQIDRNAFSFTRYDLQVRITPADGTLEGKGTITLRNDSSSPQRHAALQISSSLAWTAIQIGSAPAPAAASGVRPLEWKPAQFVSQPYTSDIDHTGALAEAIVTTPEIPPGATIELRIEYSGTVPRDATRLTRIGVPEERAITSDWDTIGDSFTAVRGVGYVCWYPVSIEAASLSSGTDVFDAIGAWKRRETGAGMWIDFQVPDGLRVDGNGGSDSSRSFYGPLDRVVPTFAVAAFKFVSNEVGGGIVVAHLPGHESQARDYAATAAGVTPLITQWFGARRRHMRIVELADPNAAAYDAGPVLFTPLRTIERKALELILAHQLTHASFDSARPWIYEGLATFAEALQREQQDGREAALAFLQSKNAILAAVEKSHAPPASASASASEANAPAANSLINTSDDVLYRTKAMYAWWMLRDMAGDAALQHALARYRPAEDRQASYIQQLLETESNKRLETFFDDWVYRDRGLPDFRIDAAFPRPSLAGTWGVTVTVENTGAAGAEVPVTVHAKEGERTSRVLVPAHAKVVARVLVPAEPVDVAVNDGSVPESDMNNNTFQIPRRQP